MDNQEKNKEDLLKSIRDTMKAAEDLDLDSEDKKNQDYELETDEPEDADIGSSLSDVIKENEEVKDNKLKDMVDRAAKKRKELNIQRKKDGVRPPKQSKFPTRSDDFLKAGLKSLHIVLYNKETDIYRDGADFSPRMVIGTPAYGKTCKKNAFERLINAQEKIREMVGDKNSDYPRWIIISNDSSMIMDRNILARLDELKEQTHCAGAYGFESIRASGKWFNTDNQEEVRGCYIQGDMNSHNWDFIVGHQFKNSTKYKITLVHGPFIAVRGSTFMNINFQDMAKKCKAGFHHYMADISLECIDKGYFVATIKTIAKQFDKIQNYFTNEDFQHDQAYFTSKWQKLLPVSIRGIGR